MENRLGLTTETRLFTVITSLTLSKQRGLTSFVLGNLVLSVLTTVSTLTVGLSGLWNVNCLNNIDVISSLLLVFMLPIMIAVLGLAKFVLKKTCSLINVLDVICVLIIDMLILTVSLSILNRLIHVVCSLHGNGASYPYIQV